MELLLTRLYAIIDDIFVLNCKIAQCFQENLKGNGTCKVQHYKFVSKFSFEFVGKFHKLKFNGTWCDARSKQSSQDRPTLPGAFGCKKKSTSVFQFLLNKS